MNPAAKMRRCYHVGNNGSQSEAQPTSQHPKNEHVSPLAHRKKALFSSSAFLGFSLQDWDAKRVKRNGPQPKPSECHGNSGHHRKNEVTHDRILLPIPESR